MNRVALVVAVLAASRVALYFAWLAADVVSPLPGSGAFPGWVLALQVFVFGAAGGFFAVAGRRDDRARLFGAQFLVLASAFTNRLFVTAAASAGAPAVVADVSNVVAAIQPEAFLAFLLWLFVARFPTSESRPAVSRTIRIGAMVSLVAGLLLFVATLWGGLQRSSGDHRWLALFDRNAAEGWYWSISTILISLGHIVMAIRSATATIGERRRVRWFVTGLIGGAAPMVIDVVLEMAIPGVAEYMAHPIPRRISGLIAYPALLSIPFTTGYAVLVNHVLDVRVVVRKAIQYTLVRLTAAITLALPVGGLAWLIYTNRQLPLSTILSGDLATVVVASVAIFAVFWWRTAIFTAIDRRFFREQYDSQQILADLAVQIRVPRDVTTLVNLLASGTQAALHPQKTTVLVKTPPSQQFVAPLGDAPPLASAATIATLVGGSSGPVRVDVADPRSPLQGLPPAERQWIEETGAHVIVPLTSSTGGLLGMILLGEKKSELPYTSDDCSLLSAVAASASLALENWHLRSTPQSGGAAGTRALVAPGQPGSLASEEPALECARCGRVHATAADRCPHCSGPLERASVPAVLARKFHVRRRIGAGGMGVVYEATDTTLDRPVALKTLTRLSSPNIERLHREAKAMAAVQHPNLAVIHGIETWKGVPILVCEYLAGGTLADRLTSCRLAPPEACDHGETLAGALDYLHHSGLLHRDVKPSNIGYALAGTVKLLDFGLARLFDDEAGAGATTTTHRPGGLDRHLKHVPGGVPAAATGMVGTLAYLPPEAIRGEAPGPGFDLWALAVTIYECVCAVNPFLKSSASATIAAVLDAHVPDPRTHEPACPPALADLLMQSLSPRTSDRPPSAAALKSGFERVRTASP